MREELPQEIGALLGTGTFFLVLFLSLLYSVDLFDALLYAVYSFFISLILGWIIGTAIVYQEQKRQDMDNLGPNLNEKETADVTTSENSEENSDSTESD